MATSLGKETEQLLKELSKHIYNGDTTLVDRKVLRSIAQDLMRGVHKGIGKRTIDWNNPDTDMMQHLTENVYQFSAAKTYQELRDMTSAIHDGEKVRNFDEYEKEVNSIIGKYNRNWLITEYNQAIAAAQSAARWNDYMKHAQDMPYLQYQCIMDANTRPEHIALHGIIKRIDDPFWDKYMPPNGWGCRCEAIQLPGSSYQETPDDNIHPFGVPDMFKTNFGKQGMVFPPEHAYYKGMPKEVWKGLESSARSAVLHYYQDLAKAGMPSTGNELTAFENLQTGQLKRSTKVRERVLNPKHARTVEETKAVRYAWNHPEQLKFERVSELGEKKDLGNSKDLQNLERKSNRGVVEYLQYSFQFGSVEYHIKTEKLEDGFEQFYSLTKP